MNEIKFLLRNTKFILPALTFLSLCKQVLFYWLFKINISEYISLDEILTPFINDALKYLFFFFIPIIVMTTLFLESVTKRNVEFFHEQQKYSRARRFVNDVKRNWGIWFASIITGALVLIKGQTFDYSLSVITYMPMFLILLWVRDEFLMKHNFKFTPENAALANIIMMFILMFTMTISGVFSKSYKIKTGNNPVVHIKMNNETIICNDSIAYLGKTKNFTFVYNRKSKSTTALENSEIRKIIFQ